MKIFEKFKVDLGVVEGGWECSLVKFGRGLRRFSCVAASCLCGFVCKMVVRRISGWPFRRIPGVSGPSIWGACVRAGGNAAAVYR